jgi:molybdenum cofactor cytidylyltransferase
VSINLCAVILAAGESTRMGRDKALLPWPPPPQENAPSETFLSASIASLSPFSDLVIVVAGKNEASIAPLVYITAATLVVNPDPSRGQFSSLQVGLREVLNRGRDAAIVTLVDRPPASAATIQSLRTAFELAVGRRQWAVVPDYAGKHGHPFLIGRELIEAFLRAPATATARDVEHQHLQYIEYVPVADRFVTMNVDTPEDYAALSAASAPRK